MELFELTCESLFNSCFVDFKLTLFIQKKSQILVFQILIGAK